MRYTIDEPHPWERRLTVTVPANVVSQHEHDALKRVAKTLRIPGFRPGKVPPKVALQAARGTINQETVDAVVNESLNSILREKQYDLVGQPQLARVDRQDSGEMVYEAAFELRPVPTNVRWEGFRATRALREIGDADVEKRIRELLEPESTLTPKNAPAELGDFIVADYQVLNAGVPDPDSRVEATTFELTETDLLPEIVAGLVGVSEGESRVIPRTSPDDSGEVPTGRDYAFTVHDVKVRELPTITDFLLIKQVEGDEAQFRENVRKGLELMAHRESEDGVTRQLLDQVVEANPMAVGPQLLAHAQRMVQQNLGLKKGQRLDPSVITMVQQEADRRLRWEILAEALIEQLGLTASREEQTEWVEQYALGHSMDLAQARAQLRQRGELEQVPRSIQTEKLLRMIRDKSEITTSAPATS